MAFNQLNVESKLMILLSKSELNSEKIIEIERLCNSLSDWKFFIQQSNNNYISQLYTLHFSNKIIANSIPITIQNECWKVYHKILAENIRFLVAFDEILLNAKKYNISIIPLKGIFLTEKIYKNQGLRHLSDIDFLVNDHDLEAVRKMMIECSWVLSNTPQTNTYIAKQLLTAHPYTFSKNKIFVEVHNRIHSGGQTFEINSKDYISRSIEINFLKHKIFILSPTDLLQHTLIHIVKHLFHGHLKIASFCDVREVIKKHESQIDWQLLLESSEKYNAKKEIIAILFISKAYWNCDIPDLLFLDFKKDEYYLKAEKRFLNYLNGDYQKLKDLDLQNEPTNLIYLKKQKGILNKINYLSNDLFPSQDYMRNRYHLSSTFLIFPFYFYRWGLGIRKLFRNLFFKKS